MVDALMVAALSLSVGVVGEGGLSPQETMAMFDAALRTGSPRLITVRPVEGRAPGFAASS